jgi:hypothetical protein
MLEDDAVVVKTEHFAATSDTWPRAGLYARRPEASCADARKAVVRRNALGVIKPGVGVDSGGRPRGGMSRLREKGG